MHQVNILKLLGFIIALLAYSFLFDPSFTSFVESAKKLEHMNIDLPVILTALGWLMGMWGLLLFLNSGKNTLRLTVLVLFIITSMINFCFFKILGSSFSTSNIARFDEVLSRLSEIPTFELMKFIGASIIFCLILKYLKPLNISFNRVFLICLLAIIIADMLVFDGNNLPLPSLYVVCGVIANKYILIITQLLQAKMGTKAVN